MSLIGHLWTVGGHIGRAARKLELAEAEEWGTVVPDEALGSVRLSGDWTAVDGRAALVIVHGLGGCSGSGYVRAAAHAAHRQGLATLRLNLRGADRKGEDLYHAGLTADLHSAIASPELGGYETLLLLGFSLGGHLALRYLLETPDDRVTAAAAVCPPLDLDACCTVIDRPGSFLYRRYMLSLLKDIYRRVAARREVPLPVETVDRIRSQRDFDDRVVAARHGFDGVDDYYSRTSVGPRLGEIQRPTLLILAEQDPLVPAASLRPFLSCASDFLESRWVRGGHLGFPANLDLGEPGARGLEEQVIHWLRVRSEAAE